MSLASFPPTEVVYDVDKSCDPTKIVLTFRGPPSAPLGHLHVRLDLDLCTYKKVKRCQEASDLRSHGHQEYAPRPPTFQTPPASIRFSFKEPQPAVHVHHRTCADSSTRPQPRALDGHHTKLTARGEIYDHWYHSSIDPAPPPPRAPGMPKPRAERSGQKFSNGGEEEKKALMKSKRNEEFMEKGLRTALYGAVEQRVQSACMSTDHILLQKRTRLRELLLAEEVAYTTEYVAMCQQAKAGREEDLRKRAAEMKAKVERDRKKFADEKLLEQKIMSCDAARPTLTQKQLQELKKDQLWQIREKYALEEAKREEDRMYHDLMMRNIMAMKEDEEENAKLLWKKQKDTQKAFIEQMKWKEQKEEQERQLKEYERLQLEEEMRLLKGEEVKEKEEKMHRKEKMKAEFKELLEREKAIKERRRREEEEIDRTFNKLLKIEEEKEKTKMASNKERLKREMKIYLEKSNELKLLKEEEERKFEKMLAELSEMKRKQKDGEIRRMKEARAEMFQNVLKGREDQIREKRERERREQEQERAEIELLTLQLQQQDKIREEYERRCAEQRREYSCQLLRQIEEVEETKKRKKEEEEEYVREMKAKEEQEIEEVKAILRALPIFPKDHPMKIIARDNPPKYPCLHPYL